ncbi:hypothetical protein ABMA28_009774 [Loxostege sticticalis]|uniref:KHA domain-containing protein n=1 Tax=Loxostege sticticalis TaxID=481309 RepID=A0ABD0SDL4_LOXSC
MIRAYVYRNIDENDGKLMVVENSIEEFKSVIATQFKLPLESITLFSPNGCEINDIRVIRDNEKVYLNHEKVEDGASCDIDKESLGKLSISETCEIHGKKGVSDWIMLNVGGIDSMIPYLNQLIWEAKSSSGNNQALTRMDVVRSIIMTHINSELRFQGVNLAGADLNRLDLRNINFKYACLSRCNLSGANLSHCCLERADLSHANLEGAQLLGVKALCANMEGANLRGSNMEDPAGSRAVMEGVNLKGANLEGSNMAGVNLRVATLKNANLQNCDLRTAVLAGADLECCDLSGSDLHEANLRGANLKDAAFELMLTPLHMSQTIR